MPALRRRANLSRPVGIDHAAGLVEPLEPRLSLDGTPDNPLHPVVEVETQYGSIYIELFPDVAPNTVANFLGYVNRGDYDNTFFHRHVADFVLQGGGYSYDEDRTPKTEHVTQLDPIDNEFNLSNVEWTVAMAKVGDDPNSATSEWFINLANNSANLDFQNSGFTVFGKVVGGQTTVQTIEGLRVVNLGGAFSSVPVTAEFDVSGDTVHNEDLVVLTNVELVYNPDLSLKGDGSVLPSGTATGADRTSVVLPNDLGRAILYRQNATGDGWTVVDLNLKSETPGDTETPVAWTDPKDGRLYAAAISADGLILYTNTGEGAWTSRNLNSEIASAGVVDRSLTVFIARGGNVFLAGLASDGDLLLFNQTGASSNGNYTWNAANLSENDLAQGGQQTPAFVSGLVAYVTRWNGLNIAGLDAAGDIHTVWWAPGQQRWSTSNLSEITNAPSLTGSVTPYLTSWGGINLAGTSSDGRVLTTWWIPAFGGDWRSADLTTLYGGPELEQGTIATYVTTWGGLNVVGRGEDGSVVVYWWAPGVAEQYGEDKWLITVLSDFIEGAEVPTGRIAGVASPAGTVNLFGAGDDGDLIRYWWRPGAQWQWENVSTNAVLI